MQVTMDFDDLGTLLLVWRSQARLSTREVAERVSGALGRSVSYMTVTRYETNEFPKGGPDPALLAALTEALSHRTSELPDVYRASVENLGELISRSRCSSRKIQRVA